jgi:hypothetical protein
VWGATDIRRDRQSLRFHLRYAVSSPPGVVAIRTVMFPHDPMHQTFVNMYEGETLAALSIVYVGADNILAKGGRDVRGWIAFTFGFIHGFGFASVLREMDLPRRALGWSLFSFNIGVEIGQLLVVVLVATAFTMLRAKSEWSRRHLAFAGSIVVIAAGAYWFVQRVFFPGGLS